MTNTKTIARNTGWYGLENAFSIVAGFVTTIAIARYLGPDKNGYIIFVNYVAFVVSTLGGFGIPATTRKYMAEFIGMGDRGTARFIYFRTLLLQVAMATLVSTGLVVWVLHYATIEYRLAAILIVLSIWPSMVNDISAMANMATEDLAKNLPASVAATIVYFIVILSTVFFRWGLVGVGSALFLMRATDFLVRIFPTMKSIRTWDTVHANPAALRERMMRFAWQAVVSMFVGLVVWERSEVVLLQLFCKDHNQVSFYSVAFSMAERLLIGSAVFGAATGATLFVQYGRDKSRLPQLTASTFRYLALTAIPLHLIATSLAVPALLFLFGKQYAGAAMVATIAPILCLPKAFIAPATSLMQSNERQRYVIWATALAGVVDIGVAYWLILSHGAVGACIGSGTAQTLVLVTLWGVAIKVYKVKLPWRQLGKIVTASVLASMAAHFIAIRFAPLWGFLLGAAGALVVYLILFRLMGILEQEDEARLNVLIHMIPKPASGVAARLLAPFIRAGVSTVIAEEVGQPAPVLEWTLPYGDARNLELATSFPEDRRYPDERKPPVRISVVIPAYNAEAFLPRCLASVFGQTMKPEEVIVVDDGSTDRSASLAEELGARVIRRPNGGVSAARNLGIRAAASEWIALLDADDIWLPEKLERQVACIRPDTVLVYSGINLFDVNGSRGDLRADDALAVRNMLRYRNPITTSTVLVRRDAIRDVGGFREDIRTCEDWELWFRLLEKGQFARVPEPLARYYIFPYSLSSSPNRMLQDLDRILDRTLLSGLTHFERWAWKHRIRAYQISGAGLTARDHGLGNELGYMMRSLYVWPSPFWEPQRFSRALVSVNDKLRRSLYGKAASLS
jgi:glycosyltransferase involved in cell wall biosynthesis/O-antigen/teichoic acid export membrane protein